MSYETICEQNKFLYSALETLTAQISFIKAKDMDIDTSGLQKRKDAIRELISLNLDKMEKIWEVEAFSYRVARKIAEPQFMETDVPTAFELAVIESYKHNPDQSQKSLSESFQVHEHVISRILTKYLSLKFNLVPSYNE